MIDIDLTLAISLNATTGIQSRQTMKLEGTCNLNQVFILVDSSSTHSFMDSQLLHKLHVEINKHDGLKVIVANGEIVNTPSTCCNLFLHLDTHSFSTDLFVVSLNGFDIILRVNVLKTLGLILWDFFLI